MTQQDAFAAEALSSGEPAAPLSHWMLSAVRRLAAWARTCADYWEAAATYEQLAALSDTELARRGLSRATIAQYVRAACDRSGDA